MELLRRVTQLKDENEQLMGVDVSNLFIANSGYDLLVIDLSSVSQELAYLASNVDLVIMEGMMISKQKFVVSKNYYPVMAAYLIILEELRSIFICWLAPFGNWAWDRKKPLCSIQVDSIMIGMEVKGQLPSSMILETAPSFCTVYVVSKGKSRCVRLTVIRKNRALLIITAVLHSTFTSLRFTNSSLGFGLTSSELSFPSLPFRSKSIDSYSNVKNKSNLPSR
ncbi:hypothetical protein RND81_03G088700 [Saponaria officinalis]|uniref:Uncharacterized protein n=1 Tax=Saponaria officinalis TaxID=3572 RepID=A0AAW1LZ28_SAPOF